MRDRGTGLKEHFMRRDTCRWRFVVGTLGAMAISVVFGAGTAAAATKVPYTDPDAVGSIGLCDQQGQTLTSGSIYDKPFVWKAIDETAAPAPYNSAGATATLFAYQPRQGVDPGDWSGTQLGASARFTNPAHPTAALTGLDGSLSVFVADFPPQWNGFVQLRIYLGAPNEPAAGGSYDATNIRVNGDRWSVVGGSSVSCGSGSAVSLEQVLATTSAVAASMKAQTTQSAASSTTKKAGSGGKAPVSQAGAGSTGAVPSAGATPQTSGSPVVAGSASAVADSTSSASSGGGGSNDTLLWILVAVGVVGAGFVAVQWLRSRG
jgi:hypothetical protein